MFRKLTLSLLLTSYAIVASIQSFATNYVWDGSVNTYALTAADSLYIPSGTFTGTISSFPAGARITINSLAIFQPSSFPNTNGNSAKGTMYVYGTFTFNTTFISNDNFTLYNYGVVTLGNTTLKGSGQTWTNSYGGILNFTSDVLMNGDLGNNNILINYQTVTCAGDFQMNSGSSIANYKDISVSGTFKVNGGTFDSQGKLSVTGNILMNNGASVIRNYCRMEASGGITNTSGNFYNYNYVWAKNSDITNSASIVNAKPPCCNSIPIIHGRNYTASNGSSMTGPAYLWFYGTTTMTGGTIGISGITTDTIKVYDKTRTQPTQIFDVQSGGTRYPNVFYTYWGDPDSNRTYLFGCSAEVALDAPLAINWRSFDVVMSNDNIPILVWSANFDKQTIFEIERSYDNRNFSKIDQVQAIEGKSDYRYNDRTVDNNATIAYYRIKATELHGEIKFSQVRMIRFSREKAAVQTMPNPFINNFRINYSSIENGMVTIRVFNINGQQKFVKNVPVIKGNNNIDIVEAANLAKGMYIVQLSNSSTIISSNKLIKQ